MYSVKGQEYVDVRGVHPVYVRGVVGVKLENKPLSISVEDAREVAAYILKSKVTLNPNQK